MGRGAVSDARRPAVFLDRDGVLNEAVIRDDKPYPPADAASLKVVPGAREALEALRAQGYLLVVVTNQPDVARGAQTQEAVDAIHQRLRAELPLDAVYSCCHDGDGCNCRKPKPGLLLNAAAELDIDLARSFMIGDRWRDVDAGAGAGCRTVFLDFGYRERVPTHPPTVTVARLQDGVAWILEQTGA
jgi:D-glycero-D-manno-heptose 1,7-bisphosphate phosphatase